MQFIVETPLRALPESVTDPLVLHAASAETGAGEGGSFAFNTLVFERKDAFRAGRFKRLFLTGRASTSCLEEMITLSGVTFVGVVLLTNPSITAAICAEEVVNFFAEASLNALRSSCSDSLVFALRWLEPFSGEDGACSFNSFVFKCESAFRAGRFKRLLLA